MNLLEKVNGGMIVDVGGGPGERRNGVRMPLFFFGDFLTVMRRSRALIRKRRFDIDASLSGDRDRDTLGIFSVAPLFLTNFFGAFFGDLVALLP